MYCRVIVSLALTFLVFLAEETKAQKYFPPIIGETWEIRTPAELNWCTDSIPSLLKFVGDNNTKAFIILVDGRIVIEQYYDSFTKDSTWYWASAGKSLLSTLVGIAVDENKIKLEDKSSKYIDTAWTNCLNVYENKIKIVHHLSMTTGINDNVNDVDCTDPICLNCIAESGTRWAYHNAVYTLLETILRGATIQPTNQYLNTKIKSKIGMNGMYFKQGYNNIYVSTARSMARFGLLAQNNFVWNNDTLLKDGKYKTQMTNSSQQLNESYGYLWWLNGKNSYMLPSTQIVFSGSIIPNAPTDMFCALGKYGQMINVIPSKNMVLIRMGNKPSDANELPMLFNNEIWKKLNLIMCNSVGLNESTTKFSIYPNPSKQFIRVDGIENGATISIFNAFGQKQNIVIENDLIDISYFSSGIYIVEYRSVNQVRKLKLIVE